MQSANITSLLHLLKQRLNKNSIIEPFDVETSKTDYMIKKEELKKLFLFENNNFIDEIIKEKYYQWPELITLSTFSNFLIYEATKLNKGKYTQGSYHMYMDYIHALYDIKCDNFYEKNQDKMGLPNYSNIKNKELYKTIYPQRKEFLFAWWIMNILKINFSKYINLNVEFQTHIDGKIFDIYIKELDLVIEYQEAKGNHDDKNSDKDKKAIVRGKGKIIEYFQESLYIKKNYIYLEEFWNNQLKKRVIQSLIKRRNLLSNNFLQTYIFDCFYEKMIKEKKEIIKSTVSSQEEKDYRIQEINALLNGTNDQINKIFSWKHKHKSEEKYCISYKDIGNLLNLRTRNEYNIIKNEMKRLVIANDNYFTDWNGLIKFLFKVNLSNIDVHSTVTSITLDYLLKVQEIYEDIMDEQDSYHNTIINNLLDNYDKREEYIKRKTTEKYEKTIQQLTNKNEELKVINSDFCTQTKKYLLTCTKVIDNVTIIQNNQNELLNTTKRTCPIGELKKINTKNKKHIEDLKEIKANIIKIDNKANYKIVNDLQVNKPIFNNIPYILYTGNISDYVSVNKVKSYLIRNYIPLKIIKEMIKVLAPSTTTPNILCKIKIVDNSLEESEEEEYVEESEEEVSSNNSLNEFTELDNDVEISKSSLSDIDESDTDDSDTDDSDTEVEIVDI